ncbi:unnamed protein product [Trypanosoma congolense IL3000]|uniref:WGS project CAEQ00000000 data, annotated contig 107 n=1 Tax=Trypanosoma congolense (strain IL3000) TaxID=1068625 RepID=F9W3M2_TRYCI|nr:unnamed protein product [Trypanosoma congolense IL3000]
MDKKLENGVRQALFGNIDKKGLSSMAQDPPGDEKPTQPMHRGSGRHVGDTNYYPGWSIPHDLLCRCTPGSYSEPFYRWWWNARLHDEAAEFPFFGRKWEDMVPDPCHGWYFDEGYQQAKGLHSSWEAVVLGCENTRSKPRGTEGHNLKEKLKKLNIAMQQFITLPEQSGGRPKLVGLEMHHTESDGEDEKRMHVRYGA